MNYVIQFHDYNLIENDIIITCRQKMSFYKRIESFLKRVRLQFYIQKAMQE